MLFLVLKFVFHSLNPLPGLAPNFQDMLTLRGSPADEVLTTPAAMALLSILFGLKFLRKKFQLRPHSWSRTQDGHPSKY